MLQKAARVLDSKKAEDIMAVDIGSISVLADYFLIASGSNTTLVQALSDTLEDKLAESGVAPLRIEGRQSSNWIVMDYGEVVVHIFYTETRRFFNLERLWSDGRLLSNAELMGENAETDKPQVQN